ncbi:MAG: hypothetical protein OEY38_00310 [Gammaproteobacteria bacterium]|nr:hypothetical protein [Gammaproteobacteria bacterium]
MNRQKQIFIRLAMIRSFELQKQVQQRNQQRVKTQNIEGAMDQCLHIIKQSESDYRDCLQSKQQLALTSMLSYPQFIRAQRHRYDQLKRLFDYELEKLQMIEQQCKRISSEERALNHLAEKKQQSISERTSKSEQCQADEFQLLKHGGTH